MTATLELTKVEGRLFTRDPLALFFGLVFPSLLLVVLGTFFPGFTDPAADLGGISYFEVYVPIALALGIATLGLVTLPPILGGYRQMGILRRFRTTPVHPWKLLSAQLTVHLAVTVIAGVAAIAAAVVLFDMSVPELPLWFSLSYLLATVSMFTIGLLVGAVARTSTAATAIGMGIYFPMLFFAGVWIPRSIMPDTLLAMSDLTPLGAAVQALEDAWFGVVPSAKSLGVMAIWAVVVGLLAVRMFRWE